LQAQYDEHDNFNEYILTENARANLLRHISAEKSNEKNYQPHHDIQEELEFS